MLRQELQSYFDAVYPYSKIDTEHTLGGQVHIQFELGEGKENGTIERVYQSTDRALKIFNETFTDPTHEIFILIYEYQGENVFNTSNDYLHKQFPPELFEKFYNQLETVNTRYFTTDDNGNDVLEKEEVRIIIGKLPVKDINVKNILNGIANTEMGFDLGIDQRIFFFDPLTDKAFQMYDDRGCYVWSNNADNIRDIYIKRNDWIVEYHRPEIEEYFK
ncbi:hypothetical protein DR864_12240 [Runella rosea]|uniref:DUF3885 domain-containing protein n=1 Tax=Runella rosea TaxID=2259595 RepID=A0A344TIJ7_9BACT|nr:DUF3885 domain-containing protein [Runella rosea]AXE18468.1 hypothetical protein DR864_12240 [Runella rosea]